MDDVSWIMGVMDKDRDRGVLSVEEASGVTKEEEEIGSCCS
jgi:hypothetical protein